MLKPVDYPEVVKTFLEIVPIHNPSENEEELTLWLVDKLTSLELDSLVQDNFGNVVAKINSNIADNTKSIMFIAHLDSVNPCKNIETLIEKDKNDYIIYSEGETILSADDKAGIAAIVEAIKIIKEGNFEYPDIELVFTVQEEIGLKGSKMLDFGLFKSKYAYSVDAEAPVGTVITQGPSQKRFQIDFWGKSSHAGMAPEKGINSIILASEFLNNIAIGRIDDSTTSNIGLIQGGTANNVVPEHTILKGEIRSLYETKLDGILSAYCVEAQKSIEKFPGAKFDFKEEFAYHGFLIETNHPVVTLALTACDNLSIEPVIKAIGSGSDANIFNYNGIETVILGVGFKKSHSLEEQISFSQLQQICKLIVNIIIEARN
ncbi:MAG: M20/M25/M40 family metallo-hydrolase [Cyanobacteriota bacterium]